MDDDQFEEHLAMIVLNVLDARDEMYRGLPPLTRFPRISVPVVAVPLMRVLAPVRPRRTCIDRDFYRRAWSMTTGTAEAYLTDRDLHRGGGLSRAHQFITGEAL